jgi:shikimate dehydrogenase
MFAAQTAQRMTYDKLLIDIGAFDEQVGQFFQQGGKGLNVTLPFKEDACRFADTLTDRARLAGAVNTLAHQADGAILGDNTDGAGLVADLLAHGWPIQNRRILVLGAGGAVRGAVPVLLQQQPSSLVIANRTIEKARVLTELFQHLGHVRASDYESLAEQEFDLIINGTSASLQGDLPPLPRGIIHPSSAVYDMMYAAVPTAFLAWSKGQGALQLADGLGMLVEQAAEAFRLWRGVQPHVEPVKAALRQSLVTLP